nr:G protein-coupled receptor [Proales similis]
MLFEILMLCGIWPIASQELCTSTNLDGNYTCSIRIDCLQPKADRSEQVPIKKQETLECCSQSPRPTVTIVASIRSAFDSTLSNRVDFETYLTTFPDKCRLNEKSLALIFYAVTGIDSSFSATNFEARISEIDIGFSQIILLNRAGVKANCSTDLGSAVFDSKYPFHLLFNEGNKYDPQTCDQMFKNANVDRLVMKGLANSMIRDNRFGIQGRRAVDDLDSRIGKLVLDGYGISFDTGLFPLRVFMQTRSVEIKGNLIRFEASVLFSSSLKELSISFTGVKKFLHNNVDWLDQTNLRSTNETLRVALNGARRYPLNYYNWFIAGINRGNAQYETLYQLDRDDDLFDSNSSFCLFYRVKQKQLNVFLYGLLFERQSQRSCGCVLFWLLQTFPQYPAYYSSFGECSLRQEQIKQECDFDSMGARCEIQTIEPIRQENGYAFVWRVKMAEFAISTVLGPLVSCLAAILNLLVLVVFRRMRSSPEFRKKKLTDKNLPLWDYIYFNTFFVLCQALILAAEPLTACIEYDGIYCSPLMLTRFAHGFYLFVQSYLGNSLKLMANLTNSLFVLYRYGINSDTLKGMRRVRPVRVVWFCFFFAFSISAVTLFKNDRFDLDIFFQDIFDYLYRQEYSKDRTKPALTVVYLSNMILGDVAFTLFNLMIDLRLLFFLRSFESSRRKEEVESRVTKMIVLNGLFSFLFRTPEITSALSYVAFSFNLLLFPSCKLAYEPTHSVCSSLFKISRLFYTFTFFENIILLLLFNSDFRDHAKNIFKSFSSTYPVN